jgi:spore coat protein CotH
LLLALGACGSGGSGSGGPGQVTGGGTGSTGGGGKTDIAPAFPIFDNTRMHDIALTMSADDWQSIINDTEGDTERHATFVYDGVTVKDVGVHPSGESSRFPGNPKISVRIAFDAFTKGQTFGGLHELKLKGQWDDSSMMRDGLAKFVYRAAIPTGQEGYGRLVVNGDLRGLYCVLEMWNEQSIAAHFSAPAGPLYRIRGVLGTDPYKYLGDASTAYMPEPWERHITKAAAGDEVIGAFLKGLAATPTMIDSVDDVDTLLGYLAASALMMNEDCLVGDSGVQDHYQYYDPASGKMFILPWDPDKTFSYSGNDETRYLEARFSRSVLATIIRDGGDYRARYKARILTVGAAVPAAAVQAEADRIYQLIKDVAHEDPVKRFDNNTFDWSVGYVKDFTAKRYNFVLTQAAGNG